MRKPLSLLVASTALSVTIGCPGWSASLDPSGPRPSAPPLTAPGLTAPGLTAPGLTAPGDTAALAMPATAADAGLLLLASGDDDDNDGHDDDDGGHDDDDDDDDDECGDDDGDCGGQRPNPAPAGTVAPPANGLFGTGAPPQVKVN
jgi:hypothetical protein